MERKGEKKEERGKEREKQTKSKLWPILVDFATLLFYHLGRSKSKISYLGTLYGPGLQGVYFFLSGFSVMIFPL